MNLRSTYRAQVFAVFALLLASAPAGADDRVAEPAPSVLVVHVRHADPAQDWLARAVASSVERELDRHRRIDVLATGEAPAPECSASTSCVVSHYGAAGADIVLVGRVRGRTVRYSLHETHTPARIATGTLDLDVDASLIDLEQQILRGFRPVLERGGLLDQFPYLADNRAPADATTAAPRQWSPRWPRRASTALAAVAAVLALPLLVGGALARRRRLARLARVPTVWASVVLIPTACILAHAAANADASAPPLLLPPRWKWLVGIASGAAWGFLIVERVRFVFPTLHGLERVRHRDVFRVIVDWTLACTQRAATLVVLYSPFALVVAWLCRALGVTGTEALLVVAPGCGLIARFWLASWVDCLRLYVDDRLVQGDASRDNPWHLEIQRYFVGYVRRMGWNIDPRLLAKTVFLPGTCDGVVSYGGASTPSRIVVSERLLELTMGSVEEATPARPAVDWPQWTAGIVAANDGAARRAVRAPEPVLPELRLDRPATASLVRAARARHPGPIGRAPNLLGYVVPGAPGELVPLIADDIADLETVRELLAEHFEWRAPDPDEEDDDTNPLDRDALFGALARELGAVERRDDQRATLALAARLRGEAGSPPLRAVTTRIRAAVHAALSRYPAIIADSYVALNFGRDHLVQYLYYLETGRADRFTTRGTPAELRRTAVDIFRTAHERPAARVDALVTCASPRNRQVWLSRFFTDAIEARREVLARRIVLAAAAATVCFLLGAAVVRAVDYHPTYVERISEQEASHDEPQPD